MEFLVRIEFSLPPDMDAAAKADLTERETARGRELCTAGAIIRIWRIPGRHANVGIWEASDATELHELLSSLPLFPWMDIDVTALAVHRLERS